MSEEKRYLIFNDVLEDHSLESIFEGCVIQVLNKTAQLVKPKEKKNYAQPDCLEFNGTKVYIVSVFEYYLWKLESSEFNYEKAIEFSEKIRKLTQFTSNEASIISVLKEWPYRTIRDPFFYSNPNDKWGYWLLKDEEIKGIVNKNYLDFAAYIAVCLIKYGASYHSVSAKEIFNYLTCLGSDLPKKLKAKGSGNLPKQVTEYKDSEVTCKANDVFATINIKIKSETEENYKKVFNFLCQLLKNDFPRSYAIAFRSPNKNYLPIKKIPKKGINQLFANAVQYDSLLEDIEKYARLTMKEFESYINFGDDACILPGSFAVFSLALLDQNFSGLAYDYLNLCDDEHSSIQNDFISSYIEKFGFTQQTIPIFLCAIDNTEELPPNKVFAQAIANDKSLQFFLTKKKEIDSFTWEGVLYALWGKDAVYEDGIKTLKKAPQELKELYKQMLLS